MIKKLFAGDLKIHSVPRTKFVNGNVVTFHFPNPRKEVDDTNERTVQIEMSEDRMMHYFHLAINYNSKNMDDLAKPYLNDIEILTRTEMDDINETFQLPDHAMLVEFLELLNETWTNLLSQHLNIRISGLREFIASDIKEAIPAMCHRNITHETLTHLMKEAESRDYDDYRFLDHRRIDTVSLLVDSVMRYFKTDLDPKRAKREIVSMLKVSGIIPKHEDIPKSLGLISRENLAAALMYIPITKLKDAMIGFSDTEIGVRFSNKMRDFLVYPEGEQLGNLDS